MLIQRYSISPAHPPPNHAWNVGMAVMPQACATSGSSSTSTCVSLGAGMMRGMVQSGSVARCTAGLLSDLAALAERLKRTGDSWPAHCSHLEKRNVGELVGHLLKVRCDHLAAAVTRAQAACPC